MTAKTYHNLMNMDEEDLIDMIRDSTSEFIDIIDMIRKEQDRDTRHACAEAVQANGCLCHKCRSTGHDICMNVKAL